MPDNVAIPAVRQNRSKLAPTSCQASSTIAPAPMAADVVIFFMALLSFVGFDTPSLTGSRRATPTSQFQQQPGHPPRSSIRALSDPVSMALSAAGMAGPRSRPAGFSPG